MMKKQIAKRMLIFVTMLFLVVATVAGCGKSSDADKEAASDEVTGTEDAEADEAEDADDKDPAASPKSTETTSSKAVVKIGFVKGSLCVAPIHLAYLNGYFEQEFAAANIKWSYEEVDLNQAAELLAAGKINACFGLTASLIKPIDNGLDIAFTTGLHTGCTKYYVKEDSDINSVNDLKDKTIGVPGLADSSTMNLKRKLLEVGIGASTDNMEVTFAEYALTDLPLALDNEAVDAVALHDPVAYQAEKEYGFKKILDTGTDEKFQGEYCCQSYVSTGLAKDNPKGAAAYTRALQKAAAFIQADPQEAAKIQLDNEFCSGDLETNAKLLESYNYAPSVSAGLTTFTSAVKELQQIGDLSADVNAEDFISKHFVKLEGVPDSISYNKDTKEFTESK